MGKAIFALAVAALIFGSIAVGGQAGTSPTRRETVGVNFRCLGASDTDKKQVFAALQRAKAGWVRLYLPWTSIQPLDPKTAGPEYPNGYNTVNIARFTACVKQARDAGLHVLVSFLDTPAWAGRAWNAPPSTEAFAAELGNLAHEYSAGELRVDAWEVWNEENTRFFWRGNARQYVQLLRASYQAVKQANPKALVVFGGTAHDDVGWIHDCYKAGARGYFDVLATHPYPRIYTNTRVGQVIGSVRGVRRVMIANHDSKTPVWFTEYDWSRSAVSAREQARLLRQSLEYMTERLPYVKAAFWFEAKTVSPDYSRHHWVSGTSLLTPTGGATPVYRALVRYDTKSPAVN